jgi:hypothetical protein
MIYEKICGISDWMIIGVYIHDDNRHIYTERLTQFADFKLNY